MEIRIIRISIDCVSHDYFTNLYDSGNAQQARMVRRVMETIQERCRPVNSRMRISELARFGFAKIGGYSEILKDSVLDCLAIVYEQKIAPIAPHPDCC